MPGEPSTITCVVPIYEGLEQTRRCLNALAASLQADDALGKVILVLDRPPHRAIVRLCTDFVEARPGVAGIIANDANLGFVRSVNAALAAWDGSSDILLLNSDAIIGRLTPTKLRRALYASSDTASACPLTNDGSFLGCPYVAGPDGPEPADGIALNELCRALNPRQTVEIPVGVGFCMLMRADVVKAIGPFDERFGRGYGEEVEWCLRARRHGYRHVAALDTFVWHEGSTSFSLGEKAALLLRNDALIDDLYPEFVSTLEDYCSTDPLGMIKAELFIHSIDPTAPIVASLSHNLGGGTQTYLSRLIAACEQTGRVHLRMFETPDEAEGLPVCHLICDQRGAYIRLRSALVPQVLRLLRARAGGLAVLAHSLLQVDRSWIEGLAADGIPYTLMLHDYQWYCPRIDLIDDSRTYCGEPPPSDCDRCLRTGPRPIYPGSEAIVAEGVGRWIDANRAILAGASKVIAPSASTAARYRAKFADLDVTVVDHQIGRIVSRIEPVPPRADGTILIAVVGGISVGKGCDWLLEFCRCLDAAGSPVTVELIGVAENIERFSGLRCFIDSGQYHHSDLGPRLRASAPDFILFPGSWPETYCYVLSEIWQAGLCPVAFDIGAIAERIRTTGAGTLIDSDVSPGNFLIALGKIIDLCRNRYGYEFSFGVDHSNEDYIEMIS